MSLGLLRAKPDRDPTATAWWSLAPQERRVLGWWLATRLASFWVAAHAAWLLGDTLEPYLGRWDQWDAELFIHIAQHGYDGDPERQGGKAEPQYYEAFFPGLPLALRAVHLVIPNWQLAGLLISFAAGAVAMVALFRIADREFGPDVASRAVIALCLSPMAVFLAAGYSEALFMAFAFTAWLCAKQGRWGVSVILAACASTTRITGLYLALALLVEYLTATDRRPPLFRSARSLAELALMAVPVLPVVAYFGYLYARTGDFLYFFVVQREGWGRQYLGVGETLGNVWHTATTPGENLGWAFIYRADLVTMAIGLLLVIVLAWRRRWPELVYVALPIVSLAPMATYSTISRTALTWWPLWITLALIAGHARRTWVTGVYLALTVPSAVLLAASFTLWRWAG
ncbi:MAG: mannosyltransferase family protein [Dermatophilaceae bacterium]